MSSDIDIVNSGDWAPGAPAQARDLLSRISLLTDYQTKWKVITVQLGGNDVCSYSCGPEDASPEAFQVMRERNIRSVTSLSRETSVRCWRSSPPLYPTPSSSSWRTSTSHATPPSPTEGSSATSW